jgi:hypothetical protein
MASPLEKRLNKLIVPLIKKELAKTVQEDFIPHFINKASEVFDRELVAAENSAAKKDPTAPSKLKSTFLTYMSANAKELVIYDGTNIKLNQKYLDDLGFPSGPGKSETDKLRLLFFYFVGIVGSQGFISSELYESFNPVAQSTSVGRFGEGFFIEESVYNKRRAALLKYFKTNIPSFNEIKSPFSGRGPVDVIMMAFQESLPMLRGSVEKATKIVFNRLNS